MDAARNYLASEAVVGRHLADQILLPMALAGGGEFVTMPVTQHFESHVEIIGKFLKRKVVTEIKGDLVLGEYLIFCVFEPYFAKEREYGDQERDFRRAAEG